MLFPQSRMPEFQICIFSLPFAGEESEDKCLILTDFINPDSSRHSPTLKCKCLLFCKSQFPHPN